MTRLRTPRLQAILQHRAIAGLLALQVAVAAAVCANTLAMLAGGIGAMRLPSGMDEAGLVVLPMPDDGAASRQDDLARLRSVPGVLAATTLVGTPFGIDISSRVARDPAGFPDLEASQYGGSPGTIATLGLRLVAGRDFSPAESADSSGAIAPDVAIASRALARRLYGDERKAVGELLYVDGHPLHVIGIVERLMRGQPSVDARDGANEFSLLRPAVPDPHLGAYLLRTHPVDARRVAFAAAAALASSHGHAIDVPGTLADARSGHFARARADMALLATSTTAFLAVTAIGIFGLSFSWVRKRTRSIGVRRALGTRRRTIALDLLAENAIVVAAGNVAGLLLALLANRWLAAHHGLPALPFAAIGSALVATWAVGAVAASIPAAWAASVPPAIALRVS